MRAITIALLVSISAIAVAACETKQPPIDTNNGLHPGNEPEPQP